MDAITLPSFVQDVSLLLVRVVLAACFIAASRNKAKNLKKFAKQNGLPVPVAFGVMLAEFGAGTALLMGIFPQFAAALIMLLTLGSMRMHIFVWHSSYWAAKGGWEYDLLMFTLASVILVSGGGAYSAV